MDLSFKPKKLEAGPKVKLKKLPTEMKKLYESDAEYEVLIRQFRVELAKRQDLLYADRKWAVLIVFQGMDTAGKDGAIKHVMSGVNPQGCQVASFKVPTPEELSHDFLWRAVLRLPPRGYIGVFNRSYYEDVLVTRVHKLVHGKKIWEERFRDIRHFEDYLTRNRTVILKFFLHLSKEEQTRRLQARLDDKSKHWKLSEGDFQERRFFDEYTDAYEDCIRNTGTDECPWYVVPADDKKNARLMLSHILVDRFEKLPLAYPEPTDEQKAFIRKMKREMSAG